LIKPRSRVLRDGMDSYLTDARKPQQTGEITMVVSPGGP